MRTLKRAGVLNRNGFNTDGLSNAAIKIGVRFGWLRRLTVPILRSNRVGAALQAVSGKVVHAFVAFFAQAFFARMEYNQNLFFTRLACLLKAKPDGMPRFTLRHGYVRVFVIHVGQEEFAGAWLPRFNAHGDITELQQRGGWGCRVLFHSLMCVAQ